MPQREFVDDVYMSDDEIERERQGDLEDEIDAAYTEYKSVLGFTVSKLLHDYYSSTTIFLWHLLVLCNCLFL